MWRLDRGEDLLPAGAALAPAGGLVLLDPGGLPLPVDVGDAGRLAVDSVAVGDRALIPVARAERPGPPARWRAGTPMKRTRGPWPNPPITAPRPSADASRKRLRGKRSPGSGSGIAASPRCAGMGGASGTGGSPRSGSMGSGSRR